MDVNKKGKDLSVSPLDTTGVPDITPVDKLYTGSARSALLIGLLPFSEARPATKEQLIASASPHTLEELDAAGDIKYAGWPEMNLIVRKGLAVKHGKYYRTQGDKAYTFWLTQLGRSWAEKIVGEVEATPKKRPAEYAEVSIQKVARQSFPYALPSGSQVSVRGLSKAPELNGKLGKVVSWYPEKSRYEVELEGGKKVSLRPGNVTGRCSVRIVDMMTRPELNGVSAQIMDFDSDAGHYTVRVNPSQCDKKGAANIAVPERYSSRPKQVESGLLKIQPINIHLSDKTPVMLTSRASDDQMAFVRVHDEDERTYAVETRGGKLFEVSRDKVVC
jgi:hypothetical protein